MLAESALDQVQQQGWVEQTSDGVQRAVNEAFNIPAGQQLANFLNGVWLGHPLHPVLIALPIGSWTATLALDGLAGLGKREMEAGADATVAVGLAGALASAVTGLTQWQYTVDRERRAGLLHGLLNVTATTVYSASLVCRLRGARRAGVVTSLIGYGIVMASGWIGGHLVYRDHLGVDHAPRQEPSKVFQPVMPEQELPEGAMTCVPVSGVPVLLARQEGRIYAMANTCSHLGGPLNEGQLGSNCVTCPWHGSQFALGDGRVLNGPATFPQPTYEVRVRNGQIEVRG